MSANRQKQWTVMVFMIGDELLQPYIERDLIEMERVGSGDDFHLIVQVQEKPGTAPKLYDFPKREVVPAGSQRDPPPVKRNLVDLAVPLEDNGGVRSLRWFLDWAQGVYRGRHYALVLWGHSLGVGFGRLGPRNRNDLIQLGQLAGVLREFRGIRGGTKLEILGFCSCATSKAEFAHELRNDVGFLVSSEVGIPVFTTWPFDIVLEKLLANPWMEPRGLAEAIIRSYRELYEPPTISLTALDLKDSGWIKVRVAKLAETILDGIQRSGNVGKIMKVAVMKAFQRARENNPYESEPVVDFLVLCDELVTSLAPLASVPPLKALAGPIVEAAQDIYVTGKGAFVAGHMSVGPRMGKLNGMTILAPIQDKSRDVNWKKFYEELQAEGLPSLWKDTRWSDVIKQLHAHGRKTRAFTQVKR